MAKKPQTKSQRAAPWSICASILKEAARFNFPVTYPRTGYYVHEYTNGSRSLAVCKLKGDIIHFDIDLSKITWDGTI
jgi:hypothetical protein